VEIWAIKGFAVCMSSLLPNKACFGSLFDRFWISNHSCNLTQMHDDRKVIRMFPFLPLMNYHISKLDP
jgi:hypothetical protein